MKNKIILTILAAFLTLSAVYAEVDKIHVAAISEFDTTNPAKTIDVRVIEDGTLGYYPLKSGDTIHCNVTKVTDPKRGKRNASFVVTPVYYTSNGNTTVIKEGYYGKYASKILSKEELKNIDKVEVGKKAAVTAGNFMIKGFSTAVSLTKGVIENEEGNRIQSGVKQVYKDSALSYVEKGQELELESGSTFYLIFKSKDGKSINDIKKDLFADD